MTKYKGVQKSIIDSRVKKAKAQKLADQLEAEGYNFCQDCKRNDCKPVDCSHDISVDQCQKDPDTPLELAWDLNNITLRGRKCHRIHDKTI